MSDRAFNRIIEDVQRMNEAEQREMSGGAYKAPTLSLTKTELEVLLGYADGKDRSEIARGRGVSPETVKKQADHIRSKLGARTIAQAIALAFRSGVID